MDADVVIAGAGLAGACAALALSTSRRVVVLDDGRPGASHAAAGLVNPFLGRKARRAWRADEALAEIARLGAEVGHPATLGGLLRPARDARQADAFQERAAEYPGVLDWWTADESASRHPDIHAPHGGLWAREGGHVEIPRLVEAILAEAERRGAKIVSARLERWSGDGLLEVRFTQRATTADHPPSIRAHRLLLCLGDGTGALAPSLPLHRIKGQTIRLSAPAGLPIPPVSGPVYVVPIVPGEVVVGATFEHHFDTIAPTPETTEDLRQRAADLVPALTEAEALEARAGVRLTVPVKVRPGRLPLVGPLEGHPGVWVFTGLGAKGLLTAPLLARHLPGWWDRPDAIWPEVSTRALAKTP
ncbi:MAG: FAD-dependent oxidoreductase [Bacteroidota bacterium]